MGEWTHTFPEQSLNVRSSTYLAHVGAGSAKAFYAPSYTSSSDLIHEGFHAYYAIQEGKYRALT